MNFQKNKLKHKIPVLKSKLKKYVNGITKVSIFAAAICLIAAILYLDVAMAKDVYYYNPQKDDQGYGSGSEKSLAMPPAKGIFAISEWTDWNLYEDINVGENQSIKVYMRARFYMGDGEVQWKVENSTNSNLKNVILNTRTYDSASSEKANGSYYSLTPFLVSGRSSEPVMMSQDILPSREIQSDGTETLMDSSKVTEIRVKVGPPTIYVCKEADKKSQIENKMIEFCKTQRITMELIQKSNMVKEEKKRKEKAKADEKPETASKPEESKKVNKTETASKPEKAVSSKKLGTANSSKKDGGKEISINLGGGVTLEMVKITGSGHDFYIGKYELTQSQWEQIMGNNPSKFKGANNPVEMVSWNDICESNGFLEKINSLKPDGYSGFRLPAEAEWEYACRAGSTTEYYWGDEMNGDYCWYQDNSQDTTHPVGQKQPNAFGLYDMSGNVWEWCSDVDGSGRVVRGGCWYSSASGCRSSYRVRVIPSYRLSSHGFRLVFAPGQ